MPATHIRIRIGAALDQSVDAAFGSLRSKARKAGEQVARELSRGMTSGVGQGTGRGGIRTSAAEREARQAAKAYATATRQFAKLEGERTKISESESRRRIAVERREAVERMRSARATARVIESSDRDVTRSAQRQERERTRNVEREGRRQQTIRARAMDRFATRTGYRAARFFWPNAPVTQMAKRAGMDILRGAGVETNLSGIVSEVTRLDEQTRKISTQAYRPGEVGAAGMRVDPSVLKRESYEIAENFGLAATSIAEGMQVFVDKRGDLEFTRSIMRDMASLAKSQGADFADVMEAASKVESAFSDQKEYAGDTTKRMKATSAVMRQIVWQGKIKSIPIGEMSKEIPKITGIAGQFAGDVGGNIGLLTGLAQLAESGPAKNAMSAGTYAQAFSLDLVQNASKFRKMGIDIFSKEDPNKIRDIEALTFDILEATSTPRKIRNQNEGDALNQVQQIQYLMSNKRARLGFEKLSQIYGGAGGGKAGAAALEQTFQDLGKHLGAAQEADDLKVALKSTSSQAAVFNAQLQKIADEALRELIPALSSLAKPAIGAAKVLGDIAVWATKNPMASLGIMLGGATVRAAIESAFRASIEAGILRGSGAMVTGLAGVETKAGLAATGLGNVAAATLAIIAALGAVALAADQTKKLIDELGGAGGPDAEKGSEVKKVGDKAASGFVKAAAHAAGSPMMAGGPGMGNIMSAGMSLAAIGERTRAEATAAGLGLSGKAPGTGTRHAEGGKSGWLGAAEMNKRLDAIKETLTRGIKITNPEDLRPKGGGTRVDQGARDVQ